MEEVIKNITNKSLDFGLELLGGLLVLIIGFRIISFLESKLKKSHRFIKVDPTAKSFLISFMSISLRILLLIIFLSIVGVPMASLVTVIGSCAVAIGLALQGGLSNIAGSLMILVFFPLFYYENNSSLFPLKYLYYLLFHH